MPKVMWGPSELATRRSLRASYAQRHLILEAEGDLPSPDYTAEITDVPTAPDEPPEFEVVRYRSSGTQTGMAVPFLVREVFAVVGRPSSVRVRHADGHDDVKVTKAGKELAALVASLPTEIRSAARVDEATGYSRAMSFDEAFVDALLRLPSPDGSGAERVTVVETGAVRGGGFGHLYVKVRRQRP